MDLVGQERINMDIQDLIEGLRIFQEYDSNPQIQVFEGEIRVILQPGVLLGKDDIIVLKEFSWRYSEDSWVRWL